ncbi:hypothetical protein AMS68_001009 [Peltaster fructicola]|uniref:CFEM domain-containing protein n=1 Tax=Peltaster fructicola TaxID=286661 RepID=A0A6H0XL71_9PEZI|nr:hypothetical protein AMS68_001009 [Peltaster fructicola]
MHPNLAIMRRDGASTAPNLPAALQNTVPYCAANCIATYIQQDFTTCQSSDLTCLCKNYSSIGYTLGEIAYGCLALNCQNQTHDLSVTLYGICSLQQNAAAPTHSAINLPSITSTSVLASSTSTSSASAAVTTTAATSDISQPSRATSTSSLTSGQAIGVSIGAFAMLMVLGAIVWLILWLRKRRVRQRAKSETGSYDFHDAAPPRALSRRLTLSSYIHPKLGRRQTRKSQTQGQTDNRKSNTIRQVGAQQQHQGQQQQHGARESDESTRTVSQLLPERLWPIPPPSVKTVTPKYAPSNDSGASPPPDIPRGPNRSVNNITRPLPTFNMPKVQATDSNFQAPPPPDIPKMPPPVIHHGYIIQAHKRNVSQDPPLSLSIPKVAGRSLKDRSKGADQARGAPKFDLQPPFFPDGYAPEIQPTRQYYVTNDSKSPDTPTPIDEDEQTRRAIPPSIRIPDRVCPEKAFRASCGSDTSFESTGSDEPTPPEEKALTPVAESPVHYPKVPRPSNQAVARTLPAVTGSLKASTKSTTPEAKLVRSQTEKVAGSMGAERQGKRAGQDSPLRGYGRVANAGLPANPKDVQSRRHQQNKPMPLRSPRTPNIKNQEVTVTSPLWEPKLTPSRRGDDLFLSVSLASPGIAPREIWASQ